jgi:hypothetical protein
VWINNALSTGKHREKVYGGIVDYIEEYNNVERRDSDCNLGTFDLVKIIFAK